MDTPFDSANGTADTVTILLVDDSPTHLEGIRQALALYGRRTRLVIAKSLAEARARLAEEQPDLAIVDLILPDGKGLELLPATGEATTFPIVVMTSDGNEKEVVDAIKRGALDYVVKSPETLADLPHLVERVRREWSRISEQRRAKQALRENEALLRVIFDQAFQLMGVMTPDGTLIKVNRTAYDFINEQDAEVLGKPFWETPWWRHSPEQQERLRAAIMAAAQGEFVRFEATHPAPDGTLAYVDFSLKPVKDDQGKVILLVPEGRDITARKRAEEALRESEERFRMIFATAAAGMVVISPAGKILRANPAFCAFTGYSEDELAQRSVEDLTHPDDREKTFHGYGEMLAGQRPSLHYEKRYLRKDGQVVWGHASVACVLAPAHQAYCVGLVQDITERVRMEKELRAANRELDAFVYTVSHDLRTPLTPIIGYAEYLGEAYQDRLDDKARGLLQSIQQQGLRMLTAMEDLLTLAKLGYLECPAEPVDVNDLLEGVIEEVRPLLAATGLGVQAGALPAVRLPRTLLQLIFQNLIGNALRYAGRDGGPIEVGGERPGDVIRFSVRDHGQGIPESEREHIFEPFSRGSTGDQVAGTGLGLATVQKIARLYGGRAWVEETPGGGCTFWVELRDLPPAGA